MGGIGSGRSLHLGAAGKVEHWRAIDLADLRRMGLLKPNADGGLHELGIIPAANGIRFVKRDDEGGKLAGLFVAYTYTPTILAAGGLRWGGSATPKPHA